MNIGPEQTYQLVEFDKGFVIMMQGDGLKRPDARPLICADRDALLEYLGQYLTLRQNGVPQREAHEKALAYARIPRVIKLP